MPGFRDMTAGFTAMALVSSLATSAVAYQLIRRAILQRTQDAQLTEFKSTVSRFVPNTVPGLLARVPQRIRRPASMLPHFAPGAPREG